MTNGNCAATPSYTDCTEFNDFPDACNKDSNCAFKTTSPTGCEKINTCSAYDEYYYLCNE